MHSFQKVSSFHASVMGGHIYIQMVRTFLTKCNSDSVASLIEKLNNHESLQHLYHTMCEVHDHFTTFVTAMEHKDPNWKFWNDFVSLNAFAYIALFASMELES